MWQNDEGMGSADVRDSLSIGCIALPILGNTLPHQVFLSSGSRKLNR